MRAMNQGLMRITCEFRTASFSNSIIKLIISLEPIKIQGQSTNLNLYILLMLFNKPVTQ